MTDKINVKYIIIFGLIGFSATAAQIVFLREFFTAFSGNELSLGIVLAAWLFWTAIGSFLAGRLKIPPEYGLNFIIILLLFTAFTAPLTVILIRLVSGSLKSVPGEMLGLIPMLISSFLIVPIYSLVSGGSFTAGVLLISDRIEGNKAIGNVYLVESIGSAISGLMLSLVLINLLTNLYICFLISLINCLLAVYLIQIVQQKLVKIFIYLVTSVIILSILLTAGIIQSKSEKIVWKDFNLVARRSSAFGTYALIKSGNIKTVFLNGNKLFSIPDMEAAEEMVHFAMLQHPDPENILLIGGGLNGSISEILKHPSVKNVDYIEADYALIDFFKNHFYKQWHKLKMNPKIRIRISDGRLFLRKSSGKYDVILLIQPDPQTAQFNRFFTEEFFKLVSVHLKPVGIFSFQTQGSENYINEEMARYLGCIFNTLKSAFKRVIVLPGDVIHFIAGSETSELTDNPDIMVNRLKERHIRTSYMREYYLPFRFSNDRINYLKQTIEIQDGIRINTDFRPLAFYFNMVLWSAQFSPEFTSIISQIEKINPGINYFIPLIFLFLLMIVFLFRSKSPYKTQIIGSLSVICIGFTSMGAEILILLIFQILYGYVYQELAILIAAFMSGLSIGTYLSLKFIPDKLSISIKRLGLFHILTGLCVGILPYFFQNIVKVIYPPIPIIILPIIFTGFTFMVGGLSGFQFPLAGSMYYNPNQNQNKGTLYGLDLSGAMIGALLLSTLIIPLLGLYIAGLMLALVNIFVALFYGILHFKFKY